MAVRHHSGRLQPEPERLDAEYVGEDGNRKRPVMLHRAIVGQLERFIGILIEQHAGALPTWLAPGAGRGAQHHRCTGRLRREMCQKRCKKHCLTKALARHRWTCATKRLRIKYASIRMQKLPYILVAGDKERAAGAVAVRARGNKDLGVMSVDAFIELHQQRHRQQSLMDEALVPALVVSVPSSYAFRSDFELKVIAIATEFRDRRHREERKHRLNREIMAPEVRLSGPENEPLGVVSSDGSPAHGR